MLRARRSPSLRPALLFGLLPCGVAAAQPPLTDAHPHGFTRPRLAPRTYFAASGLDTGGAPVGMELWASDGGTATLISDIHMGAAGSYPDNLVQLPLSAVAFFVADDGVAGRELWRTDGTTTSLVLDVAPGGRSSLPSQLTLLPGKVVFSAHRAAEGRELWVSDGTATGTMLVLDLEPGGTGSRPHGFVQLGGRLLFAATTAAHGTELWATDGTAAGTAMIADIAAGTASSTPSDLTAGPVLRPDRVFFAASDATGRRELWSTDGTAAGTRRETDIAGTAEGSAPAHLRATLFGMVFSAHHPATGRELWELTPGLGARRLTDLAPGGGSPWITELAVDAADGHALWFAANDRVHGAEPWRLRPDLGEAPARFDVNPTATPGLRGSLPFELTPWGGRLLCSAYEPAEGRELWELAAGQAPARRTTFAGARGSHPHGLAPTLTGKLLLCADDPAKGLELFALEPGAAAAVLAQDLDTRLPGQPEFRLQPTSNGLEFTYADCGAGGGLGTFFALDLAPPLDLSGFGIVGLMHLDLGALIFGPVLPIGAQGDVSFTVALPPGIDAAASQAVTANALGLRLTNHAAVSEMPPCDLGGWRIDAVHARYAHDTWEYRAPIAVLGPGTGTQQQTLWLALVVQRFDRDNGYDPELVRSMPFEPGSLPAGLPAAELEDVLVGVLPLVPAPLAGDVRGHRLELRLFDRPPAEADLAGGCRLW
jgi:ELWxxDGT repeat protein